MGDPTDPATQMGALISPAHMDKVLGYIEKAMEPDVPYNKWDDPEFIAEMDRRVKALEDGTDKGFTWEEVKERAREAVKAKKAK